MLFVPDGGKAAHHGQAFPVECQAMQTQVVDIRRQYFAGEGIHGTAGLTGRSVRIVLKRRIHPCTPRIHDTGRALTPDIEIMRMIEPERMPEFMSGGG